MRQPFRIAGLLFVLLLQGICSAQDKWSYKGEAGNKFTTKHYIIYTTMVQGELSGDLSKIMEDANAVYERASGLKSQDGLSCYIFKKRSEWEEYTKETAGDDAKTYLQIRAGGYTVGNKYVIYYAYRNDITTSIMIHEGWHQFLSRMKGRLPPFLEEGIACHLENAKLVDNELVFSRDDNRCEILRRIIEDKAFIPVGKLCTMHSGDIVGGSGEAIDSWYTHCWVFARFLMGGDNGRYKAGLNRMISDISLGQAVDRSGVHNRHGIWIRSSVAPMLAHYLDTDMLTLDMAFRRYMIRLAEDK